jgi:parvulin-like peptidyl-prolyl isomerase
MHDLNTVVLSINRVSLSLRDWLTYLKRRGRLQPLLREAALDHLLAQQASEAGLAVTDAEVQAAADAFRHRHGLSSAADTQAWLARQRLTVEDFEQSLERDLLAEKFTDHLIRNRIADHFAAQRDHYARARLRLILVAREDLARELLSQIRDEGREFAELAHEHSRHLSRSDAGRLGLVWRSQLPANLADPIFAAHEGEVVGPLASPHGFHLFLVEKLLSTALDAETTAVIRQELFDRWCEEQLSGGNLQFPLLEAL